MKSSSLEKHTCIAFLAALCLLMLTSHLAFSQQNNQYMVKKAPEGTILIDGVADEPEWESAPWESMDSLASGLAIPEASDLSARFKVLWNETKLYLYVEVNDQILDTDLSGIQVGNGYWRDGIEITWDLGLSNFSESYYPSEAPINQRRIVAPGEEFRNFWGMGVEASAYAAEQDVTIYYSESDAGYSYEIEWPWTDIAYGTASPEDSVAKYVKTDALLGFNIFVNDADGLDPDGMATEETDHRETQLAWDATTGNVFRFANEWGRLHLTGNIASINKHNNPSGIIIYPSLADDMLYFKNQTEGNRAMIVNINGEVVMRKKIDGRSLNIEELSPGMYLLILNTEGKKIRNVQRFIKK